jgi:hypothetical protein
MELFIHKLVNIIINTHTKICHLNVICLATVIYFIKNSICTSISISLRKNPTSTPFDFCNVLIQKIFYITSNCLWHVLALNYESGLFFFNQLFSMKTINATMLTCWSSKKTFVENECHAHVKSEQYSNIFS